MSADKVDALVLEAARTHRPEAAQLEQMFPGTKAWFGIFTREWWAYVPTAGTFAGPADSSEALRPMILTAQACPVHAGTRDTITSSAPSAALSTLAADIAARGAEPPFPSSAPRNHRTGGGRHARR